MIRLQKFVELGALGEGSGRIAYVLKLTSLSPAAEGMDWHVDETFSVADELLDNPGLKDVFKMAIEKGHAILTPEAKGK
jgi:hypothetical protein